MYFLITANEDGETYVTQISNIEKFLQELADGDYGKSPKFLSDRREFSTDTNEWNGAMLLIKGEVVVPKPMEVVTKYSV